MKTMGEAANDVVPTDAAEFYAADAPSINSPFAEHELVVSETDAEAQPLYATSSPFSESFSMNDEAAIDTEVSQMLLAELEDEAFVESLELLSAEAAARFVRGPAGWNQEAAVPVLDPADTTAWMESIASEADRILAELEQKFRDRPVESVSDEELDEFLGTGFGELDGFVAPLDAQEFFWKALKKKAKKVASAAKNVVKKAIKAASKVMPLGVIYGRLRTIIKPLLNRVLAKAIGKLPRSLRAPAQRLAQKYGLRPASEFESESEYFAAEFDASVAEAMTAEPNALEAFEAEVASEAAGDNEVPNAAAQLDSARARLTQQLLEAEAGHTPVDELEQFIPAAVLPIVRTGIRLIGRKRVVDFLARYLAKLIAPVVGQQLARPLSVQIADKGLGLLSLEAEASSGRLGAEAVVASIEDTLEEVFSLPDELLENELFLEAAVQDAFHRSAARHFPAAFLKPNVADPDTDDERGVWVMMPRATSPLYRYKKYSKKIPVQMTRSIAREVVFADGETLEERLADAGETTWPAQVEFEAYELLPASDLGNIAAFESDDPDAPVLDTISDFDTLEEAGPVPLPAEMKTRDRPPGRQRVVRVRVRGKKLRRRSPLSLRLDLRGAKPALRLHLFVSERRANLIAKHLAQQAHREVVTALRAMASGPLRRVTAARLGRVLTRQGIGHGASTLISLTDQLFDLLLGALAKQLPTIAGTLTNAAKDPAPGLTITAVYPFASKAAIGTASPAAPTITIRPGRRRD